MFNRILTRNNVKISGDGAQSILFAHGFGCDQNMWRYIVPEFEKDYRVVTFDYVGSGGSDLTAYSPEKYGELSGYAQDVLDICDALELEDVIFVGHSVSCMVGVLASIERPGLFEKLIMLGPSPCYINQTDYVGGFERTDIEGLLDLMDKNYLGWASFLAPVVMKNPERPELGQELEKSFCSTDPKIARKFAEATFYSDNRTDLPKLKTHSLIVQISDDNIAPVSVGEFMHRKLPGSVYHLLEASGHCPHMSHPRETTLIIKEFLARGI